MAFDYEEYLLNKLFQCRNELGLEDCDIKISSERSFVMPKDKNTLLFIIKKLTGSYVFQNILTQPLQIIVYSEMQTMNNAMQILDLFAKKYNNNSFYDNNTLIKQNYDTVVSLRPMLGVENGFKASLYCYGNLTIMENVSDIKNLTFNYMDGSTQKSELVNALSTSLGYSAVLNTTKISGQELSTSLKQEAGLTLTLTLPQTDSELCKKLNAISLGEINGNYLFNFTFEIYNATKTLNFVLTTYVLNSNTTDAPALQLTFTR